MPLQRRVPKFGFTNPNRVAYKGINSGYPPGADRSQVLLKEVTPELSSSRTALAQKKDLVKILGRGELKAGVKVSGPQVLSFTAQTAIEAAGGSIEAIH